MSRPPAGDYVIYNRVLSPTGQKLAITFHGNNKNVTVRPWASTTNQVWTLEDYDRKTQSVSPKNAGRLQAAWGDNVVQVMNAGGYVWTIRGSNSGYTIQDGGVTVHWGVASATNGASVSIGKDAGGPDQRWVLEQV